MVANDYIISSKSLYHPRTCDCKDIETNKSMMKPYSRHAQIEIERDDEYVYDV